jgi:transposase
LAYKQGNRHQMDLFPQSIEEYVQEEDPVRIYDAFVESLSMEDIEIEINCNKVGNPQYDPKAMLKLLIYGYSYGWRSSRKLERALYHNVSFIWLMGGLKPDHKTIANFRRNNKKALKEVLRQCVKLCIKLDLIEGNTLFVDGSKMRGNASINKTWTEDKWNKHLKGIEDRIEEILKECEQVDNSEEGNASLVKLKGELAKKEEMQARVKSAVDEIKREKKKSVNGTDKDCVKIKGRQGIHAGYNSQIVVDEKHGLIVNCDVVQENNDTNQFSNQIKQANEVLGKECKVACSDAGYSKVDNLKEIDDKDIKVIVPTSKQASREPENNPFGKERFLYDEEMDIYKCPEGNILRLSGYDKAKNCNQYKMTNRKICQQCKHFGVCTNNKNGRTIKRLVNEKLKERIEQLYKSDEGQEVYKRRKEKVELPFGHIKRNLNVGSFLLRGNSGVNAEMAVFSTCFNISRMMTLIGKQTLMQRLWN